MQTITIIPPTDAEATQPLPFRALANGRQASGHTMGEALDLLTAQLPAAGPTLVLI